MYKCVEEGRYIPVAVTSYILYKGGRNKNLVLLVCIQTKQSWNDIRI